jgi:putative MFS transporter
MSSVFEPATLGQRSQHVASIAARLDRLPITAYHKMIVLIVATAFFFDSMDLGSMTFMLGSIRNQFGLTTAQAGLLSSMSFLGMVFGAAGAGMLGDRFGRMTVFQVSMILWGTASVLCGLAPTVVTLGMARILLGIGMGMEFPIAQSIVSELIPTRVRGRYIALLDGGWPLGFIASGILASIVLSFASWRWVFIIEGLPAIFIFNPAPFGSRKSALACRKRTCRTSRSRHGAD